MAGKPLSGKLRPAKDEDEIVADLVNVSLAIINEFEEIGEPIDGMVELRLRLHGETIATLKRLYVEWDFLTKLDLENPDG